MFTFFPSYHHYQHLPRNFFRLCFLLVPCQWLCTITPSVITQSSIINELTEFSWDFCGSFHENKHRNELSREKKRNNFVIWSSFSRSSLLFKLDVWTSSRERKCEAYRVVSDAYHHGSDTFRAHCSDLIRFIDNDDNDDDRNIYWDVQSKMKYYASTGRIILASLTRAWKKNHGWRNVKQKTSL